MTLQFLRYSHSHYTVYKEKEQQGGGTTLWGYSDICNTPVHVWNPEFCVMTELRKTCNFYEGDVWLNLKQFDGRRFSFQFESNNQWAIGARDIFFCVDKLKKNAYKMDIWNILQPLSTAFTTTVTKTTITVTITITSTTTTNHTTITSCCCFSFKQKIDNIQSARISVL